MQFLRFLALGGLAAAVNFGSRFAWSLIAPFEAAVLLAYATGMVTAFLLFRAFVFPTSPVPLGQQLRNFVLVNLLGIALTWTTAMLLDHLVFPAIGFRFHAEAVAHAMAIAVPVFTSWVGHRRFTFATPAPAE